MMMSRWWQIYRRCSDDDGVGDDASGMTLTAWTVQTVDADDVDDDESDELYSEMLDGRSG